MKTTVKKVGTHRTLVERLRAPIDPSCVIIHPYNEVTNYGLRVMSDKLDAIGEALAYLIEKKHMKMHAKKRGG